MMMNNRSWWVLYFSNDYKTVSGKVWVSLMEIKSKIGVNFYKMLE
jgi:hypothetical protein